MKSFLIMLGATIAALLLVNYVFKEPQPKEPADQIAFSELVNRPYLARQAFLEMIKKDSQNVIPYYRLLENDHESWNEVTHKRMNAFLLPDMVPEFERLAASTDPKMSDIGNFGLGLMKYYQDDLENPSSYFDLIKDSAFPVVNYVRGEIHLHKGKWRTAEREFNRELALKGDTSKAYEKLAYMYYYNNNWNGFGKLAAHKGSYTYLPSTPLREYYFRTGAITGYYNLIIFETYHGGNILALMADILIALVWILYLRRIDIFEKESWGHIGLALFLGAIFSFITYPIEDGARLLTNTPFVNDLEGSFLYWIAGVGLVEEISKIIPFLIMLHFTKAIKKPIDYIIYASVCALGFALVENTLYFKTGIIDTIMIRALLSVTMHMFFTSLIAYGMIVSKYRKSINVIAAFFICLVVAAFMHGFFDICATNKLSIFTIAYIGIPSVFIWGVFINNALNQSSPDDVEREVDKNMLNNLINYSFAGIFLSVLLVEGYWFGPTITMQNVSLGTLLGLPFLAIVSVRLTNYDVIPTYWAPLEIRGFTVLKAGYEIVGKRLKIETFREASALAGLGDITGSVVQKLNVEDIHGHILKLDHPLTIGGDIYTEIFIGPKEDDEPVGLTADVICYFMTIPDDLDLESKELEKRDFGFVDWVKVNRLKDHPGFFRQLMDVTDIPN